MVVKEQNLSFTMSGGTANTDPDLSLGGAVSFADVWYYKDNILHNMFDQVEKDEALAGDIEYRHIYFDNLTGKQLKNCKMTILSNTREKWSKVYFAKGVAGNNYAEPTIPTEGTTPAGIDEADWISSGTLDFGTVEVDGTASFWARRVVLPGALVVNMETVKIRFFADPPAGSNTGVCQTDYHWDPLTEQCVPNATTCPEGQHLDTTTNQCVPDDDGQGGGGGGGPPPAPTDIKIVMISDTECDSEGEDVMAFICYLQPDVLCMAGDFTHNSSIGCMVDMITDCGLHDKTYPSIGNHESSEDGSDSTGDAILSEFGRASSGYYSFTVQNVHFLCMNTQADYDEGSAQYNFVVSDLQAASASASIDFIIVYHHKPPYTIPSDHPSETSARDIYHPIFDQYKVDLICNGHNHNLYRTYPIKYNASSPSSPTVMSTSPDNVYTNVDGRIYAGVGGGGRDHDAIDSQPSYFEFAEGETWGVLFIETQTVGTTKSMICNFVSAESGESIDIMNAFRINKS